MFFSFVLVKKSATKSCLVNETTIGNLSDNTDKLGYEIQIVPWVQQEKIILHEEPLDETLSNERVIDSSNFKKQFLSFLSYSTENKCILDNNSKDNTERKNSVKNFLQSHQLNVTEGENQKLIIQDLVTIKAPYTSGSCEGTNQIVLDRIRNLIDQLDMNQEQ